MRFLFNLKKKWYFNIDYLNFGDRFEMKKPKYRDVIKNLFLFLFPLKTDRLEESNLLTDSKKKLTAGILFALLKRTNVGLVPTMMSQDNIYRHRIAIC